MGDLAVHAKVAMTPELSEDAPEWAAILSMTEERGEILTPLFITPDDEVLDGRHRLKAARACKLKTVPCLVIEDEDDQARIILDSICARRHYTKSARAYLALPLIEEAVAEGIKRRTAGGAANLKNAGTARKTDTIGLLGKNGSAELAAKLGISPDLVTLARNTARIFKDSDALLDKWRLGHPAEAKRWEEHEAVGMSWNLWRAARLSDMGEKPEDPSTQELIPESFRETYEHLIFNEDWALGRVNKAAGGAMATKGKTRPDLDGGDEGQIVDSLTNKFRSWRSQLFKNWGEVSAKQRLTVCEELVTTVKGWPEDVKRAVAANLSEGRTGK